MPARALRIAFVIDDLGHGGAQRQLSLLAEAMRGRAVVGVVALSDRGHPYAERLRAAGAEVTLLPRRSSLDAGRMVKLAEALRAFAPDIVHGILDASNAYAYIAARLLRVPVVLSLRSDRVLLRGARGRVLRLMLQRADAVVANSRAGLDHLLREVGVPASRAVALPNIVTIPPGRTAADSRVIGCVGRLVPLKRFDAVIDALSAVRAAVADARLTIVGDGPSFSALRDRARPLGDAVTFTGAVDDAAPLIAGFGCLVIASEYEGLPNAALEALAAGVAVVAVRAGDTPDLVVEGVTGTVATSAAPADLAPAIIRALRDPELRASARREGPRLVAERFPAERARDALLAVYDRIANESGASTVV